MRPCDSNSITVGSCNWWVILTGQFLCDVADTMESLFMCLCCVALCCSVLEIGLYCLTTRHILSVVVNKQHTPTAV